MKNPEDIMTVESMIRTEKAFWKDIRSIHGPRRVFAQGGSHGPRLLTHVARDRPPGTLALQGVAGGRAGGLAVDWAGRAVGEFGWDVRVMWWWSLWVELSTFCHYYCCLINCIVFYCIVVIIIIFVMLFLPSSSSRPHSFVYDNHLYNSLP